MTAPALREIARVLGGEICGRQALVPGPNHSKADRSLAVRIGRSGDIICHSFSGDDWQACRDYVRNRLGLPGPEMAHWRPSPAREPLTSASADTAALAGVIWRESIDIRGTLAEKYLRGRALELPHGCSRFMRFHESCPFGQERFPALISLVRNIETDRPQAIQRTALNSDGMAVRRNGKTLRMTLGPMTGGAIKIDDDADVTLGLIVTEGCETGLAARLLGYRLVWALGSSGAIETFPVLPGIEGLTIHAEPGNASLRAVMTKSMVADDAEGLAEASSFRRSCRS